tara:strand:- start:676 stop:927 length:252 start_codon:yes stop_codon:yes gene_type:complete
MKNLSDNRFEKRLKRVSKILNSDRFHFSFIGNSVSMYDELAKIIKIITNRQGITEDRSWQLDRIKILDSVIEHINEGIKKRKI